MTIRITSGFGNAHLFVKGQLQQVKLGTTFYPYGTNWQYILGNTYTDVTVGSNALVFISFNNTAGNIVVSNFSVTGFVLGGQGRFNPPSITITSPITANVTELGLFDSTSLIQDHVFLTPVTLIAGVPTTIPFNFTDTTSRTGIVTYTEEAVIQAGSNFVIATSNVVTLNFGSFVIGNLNVNYTNPVQIPIWFHRSDSGSNTRLDVIYPSFGTNLTCNLSYQLAQTNHSYYNLPFVPYDPTQSNSSFLFTNSTNDIITVLCDDLNSNNTGKYVLTETVFPFIQQIQQFRSGAFGTTGQFGALDIITLMVIIFSMIGFNRVNESVGAFFSVAILGVAAYWGILSFPGVIAAAVAILVVITVTSTRKTGGF